jgi:thymidylate kinase
MRQGALICFEGLDGSGKTTCARSVAAALSSDGVAAELVERKDPDCGPEDLTNRMKLLKKLIWEYGDVPIGELGDYHALYNMASWFSAIDFRKIQPLMAAGITVIVDNWYFKFLSRFALKTTMNMSHLRACFSHLTRPDIILYLDVTPEIAADRKLDLGKGETGFFDGLGQPSRETFIRYQNDVRQVMNRLAIEEGWLSIDVDRRTPDQVASLVIEAIGCRARA